MFHFDFFSEYCFILIRVFENGFINSENRMNGKEKEFGEILDNSVLNFKQFSESYTLL